MTDDPALTAAADQDIARAKEAFTDLLTWWRAAAEVLGQEGYDPETRLSILVAQLTVLNRLELSTLLGVAIERIS